MDLDNESCIVVRHDKTKKEKPVIEYELQRRRLKQALTIEHTLVCQDLPKRLKKSHDIHDITAELLALRLVDTLI